MSPGPLHPHAMVPGARGGCKKLQILARPYCHTGRRPKACIISLPFDISVTPSAHRWDQGGARGLGGVPGPRRAPSPGFLRRCATGMVQSRANVAPRPRRKVVTDARPLTSGWVGALNTARLPCSQPHS